MISAEHSQNPASTNLSHNWARTRRPGEYGIDGNITLALAMTAVVVALLMTAAALALAGFVVAAAVSALAAALWAFLSTPHAAESSWSGRRFSMTSGLKATNGRSMPVVAGARS
jgi:hypothetical protein